MDFETYPFEKLNLLLDEIVSNEAYAPLSLTIGEPQFATPQFILDALEVNAPLLNKYPKTSGEPVLREGMLTYLRNRFDLELDNSQIIPTFGTREVLFNFPQFLLHDIDNPVMAFPNPFYQIYEGAAKASRAEVIYLNLDKENDFQPVIDEETLSRCDFVILNSPNNPTSSVMDMEAFRRWVKLALKHDFVLLNDECYADLYLDEPLPSLLNASIEAGNPEFKNILVINSISKRSSAPGSASVQESSLRRLSRSVLRHMDRGLQVSCSSCMPDMSGINYLLRSASYAW